MDMEIYGGLKNCTLGEMPQKLGPCLILLFQPKSYQSRKNDMLIDFM